MGAPRARTLAHLWIGAGEDELERFDRVGLQREAEVGGGRGRRAAAALHQARQVEGVASAEESVRPALPARHDGRPHVAGGGGRVRAPAAPADAERSVDFGLEQR